MRGAMGATEHLGALLQAVADDARAAMGAGRRERTDRAFKAVERVGRAVHLDLKRLVVIVAAGFAFGHGVPHRCVTCVVQTTQSVRPEAVPSLRTPPAGPTAN